jgi:hypothetical protein
MAAVAKGQRGRVRATAAIAGVVTAVTMTPTGTIGWRNRGTAVVSCPADVQYCVLCTELAPSADVYAPCKGIKL